jgi:branched-chain amino acid transport system substrate-binding protein
MRSLKWRALLFGSFALLASSTNSFAQKVYDPGVTDTEIKIGNIMAYSGPASAYGVIGKTEAAYFSMINDQGGVNGRKINFISYDDGYSPPKTVEQVRKLVESDEVLLVFGVLGTPGNSAIQKYLNAKKVPQLFLASGATKWGRGADFPWTMGWQPSYQTEARIYAKYILQTRPGGKIGVLYQNDDFGKDLLQGLKDGLGARAASMIVLEEPYEVSDPTVDAHVLKLKQSGADILVSFSTPKFAAQSIRKVAETGWKPLYLQTSVSASIGAVIKPAGIDISQGIISAAYLKDPLDPLWKNDPGVARFRAFTQRYLPDVNVWDNSMLYGYSVAKTLVQVLKQAGNNLTRANIMLQAASLKGCCDDTLLPGIKINTSANDFYPIEQMQLMRLKGDEWELFGDVIGGELDGRGTPAVAEAKLPPSVAPPAPPVAQPPAPAVAVAVPPPSRPPVVASTPSSSSKYPSSPEFGRRVALVIGNSSYKDAPALANPIRDASAVANTLQRLGFQSVTLETNLGREKMIDALRNFAHLSQSADWALVYFAGHGMEVGGVNYLLPTDATIESDRDMPFAAVPLDQVLNATDRAHKLRLVVLDACRSNPYANRMIRTSEVSSRSAVARGFSRVEPNAGTLVVYAAKDGQTASDGDGANSPFTTALLKNLQVPGVEVRRMFDNVRDDVEDFTQKRQLPYTYGSVSGREDFFFLR